MITYVSLSKKILTLKNFYLNNSFKLRKLSNNARDEVTKFKEFNDWWSSVEAKPLRAMNELRIPFIVDQLTDEQPKTVQPLKGLRLLDVGCGGGLVCEPLARLGAKITGIDPNSYGIEYCKSRLNRSSSDLKSNLNYIVSTVEQFAAKEANSQFDAVIASEVLEHIHDVESVVKATYKLLKPNGLFLITTLNQTFTAYLLAIIFAERVLKIVPEGVHHYDMLVPSLGLKTMLEKNNFYVKPIRGFIYNPFTQKWSWTWNALVSYAVVARKRKLPGADR